MRRIVLACLLSALPGCIALKESGDRAPDATAAGDSFDASEAGAMCDHREPPPPPDAAVDAVPPDGMKTEVSDLVFAISETEYGSQPTDAGPPRFPTLGFDLDHSCGGVWGCVEPSWGIDPRPREGPDGVDNAFGQVVAGTSPDIVYASPYATEVLIRVGGYARNLDQDRVDVTLYLALGLSARANGGVGPFWDGQDRWMILPEVLIAVDGGVASAFHADRGYVTGGVLVAEFDNALWPSGLTNVPRLLVTARQLTIAGRLVPPADTGSTWELQDLMAGFRVALTDSLNVLGHTPTNPLLAVSPPDGGPVATYCQDPVQYGVAKASLCRATDVTADPYAAPTAMCDAVSVGLLFQARQAQLGGVAGPAPRLPGCAPGIDPATDTCDTLGDQ